MAKQSERLLQDADSALKDRDPHKAASLYQQVLQLEPDNLDALTFLSQYALQSNQLDSAITLLTHVIKLNPADHFSRRALGEAVEAKGDLKAAETLYRQALQIRQDDPMAMCALASLLGRTGRVEQAAQIASLALDIDPNMGLYAQDPNVATRARQQITEALKHLSTVLERQHQVSVASVGSPDTVKRMANAIWPATTPHSSDLSYENLRQRPWLFYVPGLESTPFIDSALIPAAQELAASASDIIAEVTSALDPDRDGENYTMGHLGAILDPAPDWRAVHLYKGGVLQEAATRFPKTTKILAGLPLAQINAAPAVAYLAILGPGAELPIHCGGSNAHVTIHLPIIVPEDDCGMIVGGKDSTWTLGQPLVFDDSFEHQISNQSDRPRVVLVTQAYHPNLTKAEVSAMEASFAARRRWVESRSIDK